MVAELDDADTSLDIPQHAGHVTRRGNDLAVVEETAATKVARVSAKLAGTLDVVALLRVKVVDRADVVKTATSNEVTRWGVCAGHDPAGTEGDGMDLVGGVCIPDDKLAVLRGGYEMPAVGGPVHSVDLGEMTTESTTGTHDDARESGDFVRHCAD